MKRTTGPKAPQAEGFAAHAAGVTDLETLLKFVKAYYDFDEIPYRSERIRTALGILLRDRAGSATESCPGEYKSLQKAALGRA